MSLIHIRRALGCALSLVIGLVAAGLLLVVTAGPVRSTQAAPAGVVIDVNFGDSIQAAIDGAGPGDTLLINPGTYTESLTLSDAISLTGVSSATVILRALPGQRVITVTGAAINPSVVISGLTFTGGDIGGSTSCPVNCGGGLLITETAQPTLRSLIIRDNAAGQGGGVYDDASLGFDAVLFSRNVAGETGGGLSGRDMVTFTNVSFISNTVHGSGGGGGAYVVGLVTANGGRFQQNVCDVGACRAGGLFAQFVDLSGTVFLSNTSQSDGGGANVTFGSVIRGARFENNRCLTGGCTGGGLRARFGVALTNTQFISNSAVGDGGGAYAQFLTTMVSGARFERNHCSATACRGGGLFVNAVGQPLIVTGTDFISNTSGLDGGGLTAGAVLTMQASLFQGNSCSGNPCTGGGLSAINAAVLTDTVFNQNAATSGGGGAYFTAVATVFGGSFEDNQCNNSSCRGGGIYAGDSLTVTSTLFLGNSSANFGGGLAQFPAGSARVVNALFARNTASSDGQALWLDSPGAAVILHTTIASPAVRPGAAIVAANGSLAITNSILASYTVGISQTAGIASEDYNLFFSVGTPTAGGAASGSHQPIGSPRFVNPAADDYHIQNGPAMDAGLNVGVATDFEGDSRPLNAGFDLGYDESLNLAPVAAGDTYTTPKNTPLHTAAPGVLANDSDPNTDPITATVVAGPSSGSLSLALNGGFVYTPTLSFVGPVTFTYRASDGRLFSAPAVVTITVIDPIRRLYLPLLRR